LAKKNLTRSLGPHYENLSTRKKSTREAAMAIFSRKKKDEKTVVHRVWARPEMQVTFRAEIMPGRSREERTYRIKSVRPNGRVTLYNFPDEHREGEFEKINFLRDLVK
jgi:hypothetical protein